MKVTIIHGQSHKGSTYHIAHNLAEKLCQNTYNSYDIHNVNNSHNSNNTDISNDTFSAENSITEFFLPRDFDNYCIGCTQCFMQSEKKCPHYEKLAPITKAIDEADVIILESPVYVYHVTGSMKAFLDHYGWRWLVHRPEETMFTKQAVCISTAAGAGTKSTNKDMADSTFFWGVGKTYRYGIAIHSTSWNTVPQEKKEKIDKKLNRLTQKIIKKEGHVTPSFKTKAFFYLMHFAQRNGLNEADASYWQQKGWTKKVRPWK